MFDPTDPTQDRFKGYGPSNLPNKNDDELSSFVDGVMSEGPDGVARVSSRLSERGRQVLRAYAERLASLAVRRGDSTLLIKAVVAIVLGGLDENSVESLMIMA